MDRAMRINEEVFGYEFTFHVKDKISAMTHFIGFIGALIAMPILLIYYAGRGATVTELIAYGIFAFSMVGLYGASTAYHTFNLSSFRANIALKKLDHMMIFVLIAGTYTPLCLNVLPKQTGLPMFIVVWSVAFIGIIFKAFWVTCPKWVSSVLYICMGWICAFAFPAIYHTLSPRAFAWLLAGGIAYTLGGVIYALKLPLLRHIHPDFGAHELFHIFVMVGSFCHYMAMV